MFSCCFKLKEKTESKFQHHTDDHQTPFKNLRNVRAQTWEQVLSTFTLVQFSILVCVGVGVWVRPCVFSLTGNLGNVTGIKHIHFPRQR